MGAGTACPGLFQTYRFYLWRLCWGGMRWRPVRWVDQFKSTRAISPFLLVQSSTDWPSYMNVCACVKFCVEWWCPTTKNEGLGRVLYYTCTASLDSSPERLFFFTPLILQCSTLMWSIDHLPVIIGWCIHSASTSMEHDDSNGMLYLHNFNEDFTFLANKKDSECAGVHQVSPTIIPRNTEISPRRLSVSLCLSLLPSSFFLEPTTSWETSPVYRWSTLHLIIISLVDVHTPSSKRSIRPLPPWENQNIRSLRASLWMKRSSIFFRSNNALGGALGLGFRLGFE
jgi:hypothetical protein